MRTKIQGREIVSNFNNGRNQRFSTQKSVALILAEFCCSCSQSASCFSESAKISNCSGESRKAPPYPRERRPGRVAHRRSGSRRARHARGQRDAGVPHAGGKPWAGPSGIRLAIPIGVPRGGGWLLNDRQSQKAVRAHPRPRRRPRACLTAITHGSLLASKICVC